MPDPHTFLRCLDDKFTPVRDKRGRLLGCIPLIGEVDMITDANGQMYPTMFASQVCVMVDTDSQTPTAIDGFVGLDDVDADLATPVVTPSDDPDIGEPI